MLTYYRSALLTPSYPVYLNHLYYTKKRLYFDFIF